LRASAGTVANHIAALRYWNKAGQRYSRQSAPYHRVTPVSADRAACPAPHTRGKSPASGCGTAKSRETQTLRWREPDSNHRSRSNDQYPNGLKKAPELCAHGQPRCVRTREVRGRSRRVSNELFWRWLRWSRFPGAFDGVAQGDLRRLHQRQRRRAFFGVTADYRDQSV
jgi:hypothetical protein